MLFFEVWIRNVGLPLSSSVFLENILIQGDYMYFNEIIIYYWTWKTSEQDEGFLACL